MQPGWDDGQIHPVHFEHRKDLLDVVLVYLAGVMVLEAVEEVGETFTDTLRLLDHVFVRHFGVVAGRHEPRHRWPERPHADAVFHAVHNRCSFPDRLIGLVTLAVPSLLAAPDGAATYQASVPWSVRGGTRCYAAIRAPRE